MVVSSTTHTYSRSRSPPNRSIRATSTRLAPLSRPRKLFGRFATVAARWSVGEWFNRESRSSQATDRRDGIGKLNAALVDALADTAVRARLADLGQEIF